MQVDEEGELLYNEIYGKDIILLKVIEERKKLIRDRFCISSYSLISCLHLSGIIIVYTDLYPYDASYILFVRV